MSHLNPSSAGRILPGTAPGDSGAGLADNNNINNNSANNQPDVELPIPIDPRLQISVGSTQQPQESRLVDVNATEAIQPENFHRDRSPSGDTLLQDPEQDPVEEAAGQSLPKPQQTRQTASQAVDSQLPKRVEKPQKPKDQPDVTGRHSAAEIAAVEAFKTQFCEANSMSGEDFGRMVQHRETENGDFSSLGSNLTRSEFWDLLYALTPGRRPRDVQRYMRSHYVATSQKPRKWTKEQDDELVALHVEHGPNWAKIAEILGRARDDVNTRFRKRVQHRDTQTRGPWSSNECTRLESAVRQWLDIAQFPATAIYTTSDSKPGDIYRIDPRYILWTQVSDFMGNTRTREQCSAKWKTMRLKKGRETSSPS
ncbi:hypothetical protein PAAG_07429 [Paracoccidioides lutzii Pb01]|uniref:MYB DNA-binding domain-containing protein n=1 Tax=Paracoccidioides lutzii (strain ATCC MYA-826 / Pb01) TaxID=502779 RepID=C1H9I8_PARBA|nr:hypothetical protein PAAG_07429 [Paracoccidioides lutzii Pb01]EEH37011.1 hypothetical protein PAAG_07429 [Paracoccidioides lutzii Pb01]